MSDRPVVVRRVAEAIPELHLIPGDRVYFTGWGARCVRTLQTTDFAPFVDALSDPSDSTEEEVPDA